MPNVSVTTFRRWDYLKITVLGFAITALWQSLHTIILPLRLEDFVDKDWRNTYLGILTLCGLLLAMFAQPIAGAISDRSSFKWGRRRPYIFFGIIIAMLLLPGFAIAGSLAIIFVVYCLLQVSANTAQGPYQAFIPELVPADKRGTASGFRGLFELTGGVLFVLIAGWFYTKESGIGGLWRVLGALEFVLLVTMLATVLLVREPPAPAVKRQSFFGTLSHAFSKDVWKNKSFVWFLLSRLFVYMAFTTIQQFAFYYLENVVKVDDPSASSARFMVVAVVGMLIVVWPAGYLSDRIGRKLLTAISGLLGALGIGIIALSHEYNTILWAAGIIGVAMGIFNSTNWALATDFAPKNEEARYLGIANMATAGGAVLARVIGPVIDLINKKIPDSNYGYTFMLIMCVVYFLAGGVLVFGVKKRA
jgi:Na+/melibiose symporter-like transporter